MTVSPIKYLGFCYAYKFWQWNVRKDAFKFLIRCKILPFLILWQNIALYSSYHCQTISDFVIKSQPYSSQLALSFSSDTGQIVSFTSANASTCTWMYTIQFLFVVNSCHILPLPICHYNSLDLILISLAYSARYRLKCPFLWPNFGVWGKIFALCSFFFPHSFSLSAPTSLFPLT
jgi:hypothetical protein